MSTNKTQHYQLNQWAAEDKVLWEEFNADNVKIDGALAELAASAARKGNCQIQTGTYTGTGAYGKSNPNRLVFDKHVMAILIGGGMQTFCARGMDLAPVFGESVNTASNHFTWEEKAVSWYCTERAAHQLNSTGQVYSYLAFFSMD